MDNKMDNGPILISVTLGMGLSDKDINFLKAIEGRGHLHYINLYSDNYLRHKKKDESFIPFEDRKSNIDKVLAEYNTESPNISKELTRYITESPNISKELTRYIIKSSDDDGTVCELLKYLCTEYNRLIEEGKAKITFYNNGDWTKEAIIPEQKYVDEHLNGKVTILYTITI